MKNKQIQLAALTVAVAAGVMVQPVKAHAETAPDAKAAPDSEAALAPEQQPEAAAPAQSSEEIKADNEEIAAKNEKTVNGNAPAAGSEALPGAGTESSTPEGPETPAQSAESADAAAEGTPKQPGEADAEEKEPADAAPADKQQEQDDTVIAAGDKVEELGRTDGTTVKDYNEAVKDQNEAAKDHNDTVTKENEDQDLSAEDKQQLAEADEALKAAEDAVKKAQDAVDSASSIEERNARIEELNKAVEAQNKAAQDYSDLVKQLQEAKKKDVANGNTATAGSNTGTLDTNKDTLNDNQKKEDANSGLSADKVQRTEALEEAERNLAEAKSDLAEKEAALRAADPADVEHYNKVLQEYNNAKDTYNSAAEDYNNAVKQAAQDAANKKYEDTVNETLKENTAKASALLEQAKADLDTAKAALEASDPSQKNYLELVQAYNLAVQQYNQAAEDYNKAKAQEEQNVKNENTQTDEKNNSVREDNKGLDTDFSNPTVSDAAHNQDALNKLKDPSQEDHETLKGYLADLNGKKTGLEAQMELIQKKQQEMDALKQGLDETDPEQVKQYNDLVDQYNDLIDGYKTQVTNYNSVIRDYNNFKDSLADSVTGSKEMDEALKNSLAFGQFYGDNKLEHMDVKFSAASTDDKAGGYTVSGVYKDSTKKDGFSISYKTGDKSGSYQLKFNNDDLKHSYEFSRVDGQGTNLQLDWVDSTIEFYVEMKDKNGNTTGFNVKLDASTVYPEGTRYGGDKAYSLAQYKYKGADDKEHYLTAYDANGKELRREEVEALLAEAKEKKIQPEISFDISGQSIYAVSAMTCDRFFWDLDEARYYESLYKWSSKDPRIDRDDNTKLNHEKPNGLDLVLSLDTLISIAQRDNLETLKYLEYEKKLVPTYTPLQQLGTIGTPQAPAAVQTLETLADVTPLTDYRQTAEAKLNEVLQQMKQLQQELIVPDLPEVPEEPDPGPVPPQETPAETPTQTPEAPTPTAEVLVTVAQQPELPPDAAPAVVSPAAPGTTPNLVADARCNAPRHLAGALPQTGVNNAGVFGFALAGFSMLAAGFSLKLSARRGKHCKH